MKTLPSWLKIGMAAAGVAVGLACVALVAITVVSATRTAAAPIARLEGTDVWPTGTRPAPAFALGDQNGRLVSRAGLRGKIWAVTFMDSHCTRFCPIEAREMMTARRLLGSRYHFTVVVVSVLPGYDTPAHIQTFARKTGLAGDWHWLRGSKQQLAPVWREYGIYVISGLEHTAAVYLVDRHGDVRVADGVPFLPGQLAASVRALSVR